MTEPNLEERLAAYAEEDRRKAEKEKEEKERQDKELEGYSRTMIDMGSMSAEMKANMQFSWLTTAVQECITLSTAQLSSNYEPTLTDVRQSRRRAELHDAVRLATASARVLDALTRHQHRRSQQRVFKSVITKPCEDGSSARFTLSEITPVLTHRNEWEVDDESMARARAREDARQAANENAKT